MQINRRQTLTLGLLIGLLCVGRLGAQSNPPIADPIRVKRLKPYLQTPNLIGQGKYTYWGFDVYNASLWSSEATIHPEQWVNQPIALELQYLRDFNGVDIAKRSIDEMHTQDPLVKSKADIWLETLEKIFPNISKGQTLVGIYIPKVGAKILYENALIGEINDPELVKRFFDIWLSPKTSAPTLRKKLFSEM